MDPAVPAGSGSPLDVGIDPAIVALTQKRSYGGAPVGQIIPRLGEDVATMVWGCLLLLFSFCFFVCSIYAMLISEHMPDTGAPPRPHWCTAAACCGGIVRAAPLTGRTPCHLNARPGNALVDAIKQDQYVRSSPACL
eukprot:COSAG01_NODE_36199_length_520_cov_54.494062_1_plen_137_part_10